mgnify:CR=1 FL=1
MKTPASSFFATATCGVLLAALAGCGGGSDGAVATGNGAGASSSVSSVVATGSVQLLLSDGSAEDWSTIGVKVAGISFNTSGANPSRWQTRVASHSGYVVRHPKGY